jgi:dCMP deaminase
VGYDVCTCVHAEEAAMAAALKAGVSLNGASIYSTLRPCRECSKVMLNAGIYAVYYEDDFTLENAEETAAYQLLQEGFLGGVHQVSTRSLSVDGIGVSVEVTTTKVN